MSGIGTPRVKAPHQQRAGELTFFFNDTATTEIYTHLRLIDTINDEIARDLRRQLNEGGDKTLAQRREVVKRISEF